MMPAALAALLWGGSAAVAAGPGAPEPARPAAPTWWKPVARMTAHVQLQGPLEVAPGAEIVDVDGFDVPARKVAELKARGHKLVCYFSAGSWEDWRPDAERWPAALRGKPNGWPGERWVDIRQLAILRPLIAARMDMCQRKGFDAVDPDNVDGYQNDTGFRLTAADQLAFNRMLAELAHERGLAIGLKNDLAQIPQLVDLYDFAVNEQCAEHSECDALKPWIAKNKPVLHIEYNVMPSLFCPKARVLGLTSMRKNLDLDAWQVTCPF